MAGTFQTALAANANRRGCLIANTSVNAMTIAAGTPSAATALPLSAGATFNCATPFGVVLTDQLSVTSQTQGSTFVIWAQ